MHSFSCPYIPFSSFFISFQPTPSWVHSLSYSHSLWWGKSLLAFLTLASKSLRPGRLRQSVFARNRGLGWVGDQWVGSLFTANYQEILCGWSEDRGRKGYCISFPAYLSGRKQAHRVKGCWNICADVNISSQIKISKPKAGVQTETVELLDIKGLASFHLSEKEMQGAIYSQPPQCFTSLYLDNSREHLINTPSTKNEKVSFLPAR